MGFKTATMYQSLGTVEVTHTNKNESAGTVWAIYSIPCLRAPQQGHLHDLRLTAWELSNIRDSGTGRKATLTLKPLDRTNPLDAELLDFFDDGNKQLKIYVQFLGSGGTFQVQSLPVNLRM